MAKFKSLLISEFRPTIYRSRDIDLNRCYEGDQIELVLLLYYLSMLLFHLLYFPIILIFISFYLFYHISICSLNELTSMTCVSDYTLIQFDSLCIIESNNYGNCAALLSGLIACDSSINHSSLDHPHTRACAQWFSDGPWFSEVE